MPLSNSEREMLLSAALDGELSVHEQAEFDRALQDDPTFAHEFEELESLRADLLHGLAGLRSQRMPSGAVDRIVEAAMCQSASPANGSTEISTPANHIDPRKWLLPAVVGLAAAMLIALSLWKSVDAPRPVAFLDSAFDSSQSNDQSNDRPNDQSNSIQAPTPTTPEPIVAPYLLATSEVPSSSIEPRPESPAIGTSVAMATASAEPEKSNLPPKVMGISRTDEMPPPGVIAEKQTGAIAKQPLKLVLVLAVELTDKGHERLALQEALRTTNIRLGGDSLMKSEVVKYLRDANVIDTQANSAESTAKLYFIEASAKRIDEFMTHLMTDKESFASVGLSLASEPPLLAAVGDLREVDPTKIQQSGIARHLASSDGKSWSVDSNFPFMPLSQDIVESGLTRSTVAPQASANTVDDFPSQLLLLVK